MSLKQLEKEFGQLPGFFIAAIRRGKYNVLDHLYEYEYDFDAAIIDLIQPRGDGLSLTEEIRWNERLRRRDKPIHIFWLSEVEINENDDADPLSIAYRQNNVSGVFIKPHDPIKTVWIVKNMEEPKLYAAA